MAFEIIVEVPITVRDEEQATLIFAAVESGLAENAIKDRVLYGGVAPTAQQTFAKSAEKAAEASIELQPIARRSSKGVEVIAEVPKESRPRRLLGGRKFSRTGG